MFPLLCSAKKVGVNGRVKSCVRRGEPGPSGASGRGRAGAGADMRPFGGGLAPSRLRPLQGANHFGAIIVAVPVVGVHVDDLRGGSGGGGGGGTVGAGRAGRAALRV